MLFFYDTLNKTSNPKEARSKAFNKKKKVSIYSRACAKYFLVGPYAFFLDSKAARSKGLQ